MSCEVTLLMVRKSGLEGFVAGFVSTLEMTGRIYACADVLQTRTFFSFWCFYVCMSFVDLFSLPLCLPLGMRLFRSLFSLFIWRFV